MKRSLVLVTVDCLRADRVGFLGCPRPTTPFLDALAKDSIVFSEAIVAGAPTYFSFPAIIASRYPLALGRDVLGIAPGEPTIATALQSAGYATAAFLAGNPYLSARSGYDQGFTTFRDFLDSALPGDSTFASPPTKNRWSQLNRSLETASRRMPLTATAYNELYFWYCQWRTARQNLPMDSLRRYPSADVIVDQARSWLSSLGDEPFFLWLHLMDPHHPYYPPQEALSSVGAPHLTARRARFLNSFWNRADVSLRRLQRYRAEILSLYDAGVYWVDKQISRLVQALQHFQRWDKTILVVTADHGEEFLEHGARYHSPVKLPEQLIHVPLLVGAPERSGRHLSQGPFSLLHLAPTLLEAMGIGVPDTFRGQSWWKQISTGDLPSEPAIAECIEACNNPFQVEDRMRPRLLAVRDRDYKLVVRFTEKKDYFYDLKNDPEERSPLPVGVLAKERARLLQAALGHLQRTRGDENHDLALRARLRDLQQSIILKRHPISALTA
jgi:arylsulfatase A-like enzyme